MSKPDHDFINTSKAQDYELKDWLYRNQFSKSDANYNSLVKIINDKIKKGQTSSNVKWEELDSELAANPGLFKSLTKLA